MTIDDLLRGEAEAFMSSVQAVLSEQDKAILAERIADYNVLATRAYAGEDVAAALASRRRSLDGYSKAVGVAIGEVYTARITRALTRVFTAALGALG